MRHGEDSYGDVVATFMEDGYNWNMLEAYRIKLIYLSHDWPEDIDSLSMGILICKILAAVELMVTIDVHKLVMSKIQ